MPRKKSRLVGFGVAASVFAAATLVGVAALQIDKGSAGAADPNAPAQLPYGDDLGSAGLARGVGYDLYWLGPQFRGLALSGINRADGPAPTFPSNMPAPARKPGRQVNVTFLYGTCETEGDSGCPIPLQVQVWPACQRNLADYTWDGKNPLPHVRKTIRGVPAAQFNDRLELYSGASTIVIFGDDEAVETAAAGALIHTSKPIGPGDRLPGPAEGALTGQIAGCQR